MPFTVKSNVAELQRNLRRLGTTSIAFATKRAADRAAKLSVKILRDRAGRRMTIRRRNFPVFVVRKAKVKKGYANLSKPAMVFNHSSIEDIMRLQVHGGIRKPERGKFLLIRADESKWGRRFTGAQRARQYTARGKGGKVNIYRRLPRENKRVAFLREQANVRIHYRPYDALPQITDMYARLARLYLRAEFAAWERRYGRPSVS